MTESKGNGGAKNGKGACKITSPAGNYEYPPLHSSIPKAYHEDPAGEPESERQNNNGNQEARHPFQSPLGKNGQTRAQTPPFIKHYQRQVDRLTQVRASA